MLLKTALIKLKKSLSITTPQNILESVQKDNEVEGRVQVSDIIIQQTNLNRYGYTNTLLSISQIALLKKFY